MTARGIAATAAEPISTSGVDFLAVQLAPIELLVRPFGFQELKDGQPLPRALQFLDRRRHHEAYYIDASDHQELLEFEEAWRVKKEKMIAEAEARRADRQHPGHHASETADRNSPWIRDELILALDLYVRHAGNPPGKTSQDISELSALLNRLGDVTGRTHQATYRNANGVYMKCMNFRRFDPAYTSSGRKGLTRGNKLEEEVWNEFAEQPARLHKTAAAIREAIEVGDVEVIDDAVDDDYEAAEGKVLTALHRRRERSRTIVRKRKEKALKETGELRCEGCGMTFEERYGDIGHGFIEVHHTRPVHELQPGDKTKLADLALVCSNCHRMIHHRRPWLSMSELRAIVRS